MGYMYHELVIPAFLLDNPGLTKEELVERFSRMPSGLDHFEEDFPLEGRFDSAFPLMKNLDEFADKFRIKYKQEFIDFDSNRKEDENGLYIDSPKIHEPENSQYKYVVVIHKENIVHPPKRTTQWSWHELSIGSIWEEVQNGEETGIVRKIFEVINSPSGNEDEPCDGPSYRYDMELSLIEEKYDIEKFMTEEDLFEKWPQFHPENKFDFSQESGSFFAGMNSDQYHWYQKNSRYYLDKEKTFNRIPAGTAKSIKYGYTDLILTAEAVKHSAWKIISYRGKDHMEQFLKAFPDSVKRYNKAVWDSHTSIYAKEKGITVNELLRLRMLGGVKDYDPKLES